MRFEPAPTQKERMVARRPDTTLVSQILSTSSRSTGGVATFGNIKLPVSFAAKLPVTFRPLSHQSATNLTCNIYRLNLNPSFRRRCIVWGGGKDGWWSEVEVKFVCDDVKPLVLAGHVIHFCENLGLHLEIHTATLVPPYVSPYHQSHLHHLVSTQLSVRTTVSLFWCFPALSLHSRLSFSNQAVKVVLLGNRFYSHLRPRNLPRLSFQTFCKSSPTSFHHPS